MRNAIIEKFEKKQAVAGHELPLFRVGDTLRVHYKIEESAGKKKGDEGKKFRIQPFEGVCIRYTKGSPMSTSFTVRKSGANGVGVERIFPVNSPFVDKVEIISHGRVRRARLFYLRNRSGRSARIKSRFVNTKKTAN